MIENAKILHAETPGVTIEIGGALGQLVTPHSFVVRTLDNSLRQPGQKVQVAAGRELLMSPFDECDMDIEPGAIVVARIEMFPCATFYVLTRYTPVGGQNLRAGAGSAEYEDADFHNVEIAEFGAEIKRISVSAICRGVIDKVFV